MRKPEEDERYKIMFHFITEKDVLPAEIKLIENQLGELLQQIIRDGVLED